MGVGETLDLIDAGSIGGAFNGLVVTGQELGIGQEYQLVPSSGGNGTVLGLTVLQKAVLTINRQTGSAVLENPGSTPIELDALTIQSASGGLDSSAFVGLPAPQWITSPGNANRVTQLRNSGVEVLGPGASFALGNIFAPPVPEFGIPISANEDLELDYANSSAAEIDGVVTYVGSIPANNMVVSIDSATGAATMKNDSQYTIDLEGYTITSELGLLTPNSWNSFEDQGLNGGNWDDSLGSDAGRLTELIMSGVATIGPNQVLDLGTIYDVSAPNGDTIGFEILLAGAGTPNILTGVVQFVSGVSGDFNGDGSVDAADYTVYRDNLGSNTPLPNDNGLGTPIGAAHYDLWRSNFGATTSGSLAAGQVPEPHTVLLAGAGIAAGLLYQVGRRAVNKAHR